MTAPPAGSLLADLLSSAAARWPDRPAVTGEGQTWNYRELASAAGSFAARLSERGLRRGCRLLIHLPDSVLLPALVYGSARLGVAFSVLNEQVRGTHLEHVLDDSEPALLISHSAQARAMAESRGITAIDGAAAYRDATGSASPANGIQASPLAVDIACLIYTSGTTALPKAVVSTHEQVVVAARLIQSVLGYRHDDVVYCPLPLSFDYGLYQLFLATLAGAHVWLAKANEIGPPLLNGLARSGGTVLAAVPSVAQALARLLRRSGGRALPLRKLTSTGAAMPVETLATLREFLPDLRVQLMFGLTECKRATVMPEDGDLLRPGSAGRALPGTEVYAADPGGRRLPPGEIGEIVVRGPNVMAGYWRRPELTAQRFPRAEGLLPELRTGDYGWLDDEGYLYVSGRRDDLYKENGFRVSCTEVEAAARRVAGVDSAAVLAPAGTAPARLFVTGSLDAAEVLRAMRQDLEEFKVPGVCWVLDALPLTANGKVDRARLAAVAEQEETTHGR
ncbi:class I adenylate-forming enzyme family protein [Amycolatopsis silviterrae]|uniref:Class I adenylate-forming enzyme family protein n=1 Tax=Amycolatopsis silviterrae TaxID=1656914 RepID=A0ABW5H3V0_9PSEU